MRLVELKVSEFLREVDSQSPAPGGGSVSALASSLGVALAKMVYHLTKDKIAFKSLDLEDKAIFNEAVSIVEDYNQSITNLIDEDTIAFNQFMSALKLPKETEEEKLKRKEALNNASIYATKVPLVLAKSSIEVLKQLRTILKYCNKNTVSDLGVSALLLDSGIKGALLNVLINDSSYEEEVRQLEAQSTIEKDLVLSEVKTLILK